MSVAQEIIKKLPENGNLSFWAYFGQFFEDFSGYRHRRAKILTVLESAHPDLSVDTHKYQLFDSLFFYLTNGGCTFKPPWDF